MPTCTHNTIDTDYKDYLEINRFSLTELVFPDQQISVAALDHPANPEVRHDILKCCAVLCCTTCLYSLPCANLGQGTALTFAMVRYICMLRLTDLQAPEAMQSCKPVSFLAALQQIVSLLSPLWHSILSAYPPPRQGPWCQLISLQKVMTTATDTRALQVG